MKFHNSKISWLINVSFYMFTTDYVALIANEKANYTQDVISDLIYFLDEVIWTWFSLQLLPQGSTLYSIWVLGKWFRAFGLVCDACGIKNPVVFCVVTTRTTWNAKKTTWIPHPLALPQVPQEYLWYRMFLWYLCGNNWYNTRIFL